jgi:hypothetical protein
MDIHLILWLVLAGLFGGYLSGLLGVGGGIIFVPILDYLFAREGLEGAEQVKYVLANSFMIILVSGLVSSYRQFRNDNFFLSEILKVGIPAAVASWLTSWTIAGGKWFDDLYFKIIFLTLVGLMLVRRLFRKRPAETVGEAQVGPFRATVSGIFAGVVSALSGLGGGVVMIPMFTGYLKMSLKQAASVSIGVIPIIVLPGIIAYSGEDAVGAVDRFQVGYICLGWLLPLVPSILFSAQLGVNHANRFSSKVLERIFVALVVIVLAKTFFQLLNNYA